MTEATAPEASTAPSHILPGDAARAGQSSSPARLGRTTGRSKAPARWAVAGAAALSFAWFWGAVVPHTTGQVAASGTTLVSADPSTAAVGRGDFSARGGRGAPGQSAAGGSASTAPSSPARAQAPSSAGQSSSAPRLRTRGS